MVADADGDVWWWLCGVWRCGWIEGHGFGRGRTSKRRRVRRGCYCYFDWGALVAGFDGGSEGVFEEFGEDVGEVGGDVGEARVGLAVYHDARTDAVFQLADFRDEGFAVADYRGGAERCVDYAD